MCVLMSIIYYSCESHVMHVPQCLISCILLSMFGSVPLRFYKHIKTIVEHLGLSHGLDQRGGGGESEGGGGGCACRTLIHGIHQPRFGW